MNSEPFKRRGNVEGKAILDKARNPLKKVLIIIHEDTDNTLRDMAFAAKKSKSELIREALEAYIGI